MLIDRYMDNRKDVEFEKAVDALDREVREAHEGLMAYYEELAQERDTEEDISAQYEEHMLEIIGAV
jgi:hypothetical protein